MKENEIENGKVLMIGDLVIGCFETDKVGEAAYKIPCKVTGINHYGDVSCEALEPFPDELDWQEGDDFSWIEAIRITPEAVEKNGFVGNNRYQYTYKDLFCKVCISFAPRIEIDGMDLGEPPIHLSIQGALFDISMAISFIHELQQALRLCGIKKSIEL